MTTATAPDLIATPYRATKAADGTFTVHDVPILGTLPRGERGNTEEIGKDWMLAALAAHRAAESGGYLPPLKFTHGDGTRKQGFFRPIRVGTMAYEGKPIAVLYADLVGVNAATLAAIRAGELPYRSVEVLDWDVPRVTALALLSGDAPYFRFPVMSRVDVDGDTETRTFHSGHVACLSAVPSRRALTVVSRLGAFPPAKDDGADDGDDEGGPPAKAAADDGAAPGAQPGGDEKTNTVLQSLVAGINAILKLLTGKGQGDPAAQPVRDEHEEEDAPLGDDADAGVPGKSGANDGPGDDAATDDDPEDKAQKGREKHMAAATDTTNRLDAKTTARLAALEGENTSLKTQLAAQTANLSALQTRLDAKDTAEKNADLIAKGRARLMAAKVVMPADFDANAAKFAAGGAELLETFVATLEQSGRKDPPASFAAALDSGAANALDEQACIAFASGKGAGALEKAREELVKYRAHVAVCPKTDMTLAAWLAYAVKV